MVEMLLLMLSLGLGFKFNRNVIAVTDTVPMARDGSVHA